MVRMHQTIQVMHQYVKVRATDTCISVPQFHRRRTPCEIEVRRGLPIREQVVGRREIVAREHHVAARHHRRIRTRDEIACTLAWQGRKGLAISLRAPRHR